MRLINNKYELLIEYVLDIHTFEKKIFYTLFDYEYNQKHKFEEAKKLVETLNFNDVIEYLIKNGNL